MSRQRSGITMAEVLVVLAVIAMAVGLMLPAVRRVHEPAARSASSNNIKQLSLALHNYESAHGRLPPLVGGTPTTGAPFVTPTPADPAYSEEYAEVYGPTHVFLLPYLEQEPLYQGMEVGVAGPPPQKLLFPSTRLPGNGRHAYQKPIKTFYSPSDPSLSAGLAGAAISAPNNPDAPANGLAPPAGATSYAANAQLFGEPDVVPNANKGQAPSRLVSLDRASTIANIPDGSSSTIAFAEKYGQCGSTAEGTVGVAGGSLWAEPNLNYYSPIFAGQIDKAGSSPVGPNFMAGEGLKFQIRPNPWDGPNAQGNHCDPRRAQTPHVGGILVGLADGSVRSINPGVSVRTWELAVSPDDGVGLGADW